MSFAFRPSQAYVLIGNISKMLMARGAMLGGAESCTGGLVSALCTEIPGSSAWFSGAIISYSNEVKQKLVGVDPAILKRCGAVSEETVRAMALGALRALEVQVAYAVSGVAGPGGGTPEKPVGTVWLAVASKEGAVFNTKHCLFRGDRGQIRMQSVLSVLELMEQMLVHSS